MEKSNHSASTTNKKLLKVPVKTRGENYSTKMSQAKISPEIKALIRVLKLKIEN